MIKQNFLTNELNNTTIISTFNDNSNITNIKTQHQHIITTIVSFKFKQQHMIKNSVISSTCFYELTAKEIIWSLYRKT